MSLALSGVRVIGIDEAPNTVFTARNSNNDEILYCQRREGEAVTIFVVDGRDVPDQVSGLGGESNDVGVERGHEYLVAEDGKAEIDAAGTWPNDVRQFTLAAADRPSSAGVERERAVGLAGE